MIDHIGINCGDYARSQGFYDTAVGVATKAGREVPMPAIVTRSCP